MSRRTAKSRVADLSAELADTSLSDHISLSKAIESQWNVCSMTLASGFHEYACTVHENCDGTCQGVYQEDPPFVSLTTHMFSMLLGAVSLQSSRVTTEDLPHDVAWMEERGFPQHLYCGIDSSAGEIRLLKVKKAVFRSDVVECEIITAFLGNASEFQALSYCWGSDGLTDVMLCDSRRHFISPSLNTALKAYREGPLHDTPLWVDAVSIDQANKAEMGEQIPLMRQIYTEAAGVFVHLGEAERPWFQGLDLMFLLSILQERSKTAEDEVTAIMYDILPSLEHPSWTHFLDTFSSPWFRRTWILQEIALSKSARVCNGHFGAVDWDVIEAAYRFFTESGIAPRVMLKNKNSEIARSMLNVRRILQIIDIAHSPNETSLMQVLDVTHHFEVSDPRDKIIGVLGIVGELPETLRSLIDYGLSPSQVYHLAAIYLIKLGIPGKVLDHAGLQRQSRASDMPSWVPGWNADISESNNRPLTLFRPMPFNAGGTEGGFFHIFREEGEVYPRELAGRGFYHHTITKLSDILSTSGQRLESFDLLQAAKDCYEGSRGFAYRNAEEAFARTLLVDDLYTGGNAIRTMGPIEHLRPTFRTVMKYLENRSQHPEKKNIEITKGTTGDEVQTCLSQMSAAIFGRRLAITDTGYMALVADRTQVGDAVAFLLGTRVPYTVRPNWASKKLKYERDEIHAKLVGDCYVHAMMQGEVIAEAIRRRKEWSVIVLD